MLPSCFLVFLVYGRPKKKQGKRGGKTFIWSAQLYFCKEFRCSGVSTVCNLREGKWKGWSVGKQCWRKGNVSFLSDRRKWKFLFSVVLDFFFTYYSLSLTTRVWKWTLSPHTVNIFFFSHGQTTTLVYKLHNVHRQPKESFGTLNTNFPTEMNQSKF